MGVGRAREAKGASSKSYLSSAKRGQEAHTSRDVYILSSGEQGKRRRHRRIQNDSERRLKCASSAVYPSTRGIDS